MQVVPHILLILASVGFIFGIGLAGTNIGPYLFPITLVGIFATLRKPVYVAVISMAIILGGARYMLSENNFQKSLVQNTEVNGTYFVKDVEKGTEYATVITQLFSVRQKNPIDIKPGDIIKVKGRIMPDDYLKGRNMLGRLNAESLYVTGHSHKLRYLLPNYRLRLEDQASRILREPNSSLLSGLLFGSRGGLRGQALEQFNITGTTHIVAVSGFNVAVLIGLILLLFRRKSVVNFILASFLIALYVLLVGASASAVRAGIMGVVALLGTNYVGRKKDRSAPLFLAAALMLLFNPFLLLNDIGFVLSFAATAGLIFFAPVIAEKLPLPNVFRQAAGITLAAFLFTLPFIAATFGTLSLVAVFANLLIVPLVPVAMLLGLLVLVISFISLPASIALGFVPNIVLNLIFKIVEIFAALPFAQLNIRLPYAGLILGCAGIGIFVFYQIKTSLYETAQ